MEFGLYNHKTVIQPYILYVLSFQVRTYKLFQYYNSYSLLLGLRFKLFLF